MLTPKEEKLLALALDKAAHSGEWATAAMKLFHSLRDRGVDGLGGIKKKIDPSIEPGLKVPSKDWPGSIELTFGKYRGKTLAQIDPGYFHWCIENLDPQRNAALIKAMQWMLDDLHEKRRNARR